MRTRDNKPSSSGSGSGGASRKQQHSNKQQTAHQHHHQQSSHHQQQQHHHHHHDSHNAVDSTYFFPGAASLSDHIDNRVMIILRDGKKLIGTLRSYDQFANMVLEDTVERIVVEKNFGDFPLGLYMVRGENVVLMGEIDETLEQQMEQSQSLNRVSLPQILQEQKEYKEAQMALLLARESAFDI